MRRGVIRIPIWFYSYFVMEIFPSRTSWNYAISFFLVAHTSELYYQCNSIWSLYKVIILLLFVWHTLLALYRVSASFSKGPTRMLPLRATKIIRWRSNIKFPRKTTRIFHGRSDKKLPLRVARIIHSKSNIKSPLNAVMILHWRSDVKFPLRTTKILYWRSDVNFLLRTIRILHWRSSVKLPLMAAKILH